jgi:hypothetical protein
MATSSYESINAWLADVREKNAEPTDEATAEGLSRFFAKWGASVSPAQDEAKSRVLDSPDMESRYAVDRLTKKPDGTTVVRYYFPNDAVEVNALCANDSMLHSQCTPEEDNARKQAREAMKDIATESRAKIEFQEVFSLEGADIAFVRSPKGIEEDGRRADGYAGRSGGKNYIVDGMGASDYRQVMEQAFNLLPPEQREKAKEKILEVYGKKYGKDANIFTILASEREKMDFAHEIEHTLGAKHPDAGGGPQVTKNESIMGAAALGDRPGKTLGSLDVEWYQRHFGIKDLPEGALPSPSATSTEKSVTKKTR